MWYNIKAMKGENCFAKGMERKMDWLHRERMLIGDEAVGKLQSASVLVFGVGGVGGYVVEGLVRAGIGKLSLVDNDTISETNLNRQIIADRTTIGKSKVEVMQARIKSINPDCEVKIFETFADAQNTGKIIDEAAPDFIVDAIDTVTTKIEIIKCAKARDIRVISSMGTGSKLDPTRFRVVDISKTHTDPLAKVMRLKLREAGINHVEVLFSDELPVKNSMASELEGKVTRHIPGSISFVPPTAGLVIAAQVVKELIG